MSAPGLNGLTIASSEEVGGLGVVQLKRLWSRTVAKEQGEGEWVAGKEVAVGSTM